MGRKEKIMKYKTEHLIEYIFVRIAGGILFIMPTAITRSLAWLTARVMFHIMRYRRDEAERRIVSVFNCTPKRAKEIAWGSLLNLCMMGAESLRMADFRAKKLVKHPAGPTYTKTYEAHKSRFGECGIIFAGPHMGHWEQCGLAGKAAGIPFFFLAKRQKNPLIDAYINKKRSTYGAEAVQNDSKVLRHIIQRLKNGEALAILPDISEKSRTVMQINFLGGIANINPGAAMFARKTHCPIYPGCGLYLKGKHHIHIADPIAPDETLSKDEDYQRIMQLIFDFFDEQIRAYPEQYFWYNKRWILEPPKQKK
jgi:KDO2-lipid IV(A) lauroyltransferase